MLAIALLVSSITPLSAKDIGSKLARADPLGPYITLPPNARVNDCAQKCNENAECDCYTFQVRTIGLPRCSLKKRRPDTSRGSGCTVFPFRSAVGRKSRPGISASDAGQGNYKIELSSVVDVKNISHVLNPANCREKCDAHAQCDCWFWRSFSRGPRCRLMRTRAGLQKCEIRQLAITSFLSGLKDLAVKTLVRNGYLVRNVAMIERRKSRTAHDCYSQCKTHHACECFTWSQERPRSCALFKKRGRHGCAFVKMESFAGSRATPTPSSGVSMLPQYSMKVTNILNTTDTRTPKQCAETCGMQDACECFVWANHKDHSSRNRRNACQLHKSPCTIGQRDLSNAVAGLKNHPDREPVTKTPTLTPKRSRPLRYVRAKSPRTTTTMPPMVTSHLAVDEMDSFYVHPATENKNVRASNDTTHSDDQAGRMPVDKKNGDALLGYQADSRAPPRAVDPGVNTLGVHSAKEQALYHGAIKRVRHDCNCGKIIATFQHGYTTRDKCGEACGKDPQCKSFAIWTSVALQGQCALFDRICTSNEVCFKPTRTEEGYHNVAYNYDRGTSKRVLQDCRCGKIVAWYPEDYGTQEKCEKACGGHWQCESFAVSSTVRTQWHCELFDRKCDPNVCYILTNTAGGEHNDAYNYDRDEDDHGEDHRSEDACDDGENDFQCSDGTCIWSGYVCDGNYDCSNNRDEEGCVCREDQFRCGNGACVNLAWKCDGVADCDDSSDETGCTCTTNQFTCGSGGCVDISWRCDGGGDCEDSSDETNCTCTTNQFTCGSGGCVDISWRCDGVPDCDDSSDETYCKCIDNDFQCSNGFCIQQYLRCDGNNNCDDNSDEYDCPRCLEPSPLPPHVRVVVSHPFAGEGHFNVQLVCEHGYLAVVLEARQCATAGTPYTISGSCVPVEEWCKVLFAVDGLCATPMHLEQYFPRACSWCAEFPGISIKHTIASWTNGSLDDVEERESFKLHSGNVTAAGTTFTQHPIARATTTTTAITTNTTATTTTASDSVASTLDSTTINVPTARMNPTINATTTSTTTTSATARITAFGAVAGSTSPASLTSIPKTITKTTTSLTDATSSTSTSTRIVNMTPGDATIADPITSASVAAVRIVTPPMNATISANTGAISNRRITPDASAVPPTVFSSNVGITAPADTIATSRSPAASPATVITTAPHAHSPHPRRVTPTPSRATDTKVSSLRTTHQSPRNGSLVEDRHRSEVSPLPFMWIPLLAIILLVLTIYLMWSTRSAAFKLKHRMSSDGEQSRNGSRSGTYETSSSSDVTFLSV